MIPSSSWSSASSSATTRSFRTDGRPEVQGRSEEFDQIDTEQAYHLYCVAREFANLTGDELVYDLYTGTGTIANFVAHKAKKVIGIEYVPEAIAGTPRLHSQVNNIENTLFYARRHEGYPDQRFHRAARST